MVELLSEEQGVAGSSPALNTIMWCSSIRSEQVPYKGKMWVQVPTPRPCNVFTVLLTSSNRLMESKFDKRAETVLKTDWSETAGVQVLCSPPYILVVQLKEQSPSKG